MKTFVPHYFNKFKCTAGECRHNCCIGWEIDIDSVSFRKYIELNTSFGRKILNNTQFIDGCNCFMPTKNGRCPFLNENNLCDIILNLGEDYLCDICTDHPRFRHFYSDRIEIGLGLCCEESCKIILSDMADFSLVSTDDEIENLTDEEISFIEERGEIIKAVENSSDVFSAIEKINTVYELTEVNLNEEIADTVYSGLEMLDTGWKDKLKTLKNGCKCPAKNINEHIFLNIYKYFLFRHLSDDNFYESLVFSEISVKMIYLLCEHTDFSFDNICEISRMYSAEIEYSDENIYKVISLALG